MVVPGPSGRRELPGPTIPSHMYREDYGGKGSGGRRPSDLGPQKLWRRVAPEVII